MPDTSTISAARLSTTMRLVRLVNSGIAEARENHAAARRRTPAASRRGGQISQLPVLDPCRHRGTRAVLPLRSP